MGFLSLVAYMGDIIYIHIQILTKYACGTYSQLFIVRVDSRLKTDTEKKIVYTVRIHI